MKNKHKINPFWTYSRKERIGIAILTAGIILNAGLKWKNTELLKSQLLQNVYVEYSFISTDTTPTKNTFIKKEVRNTSGPTKQKSYVKAVNLWNQDTKALKKLGLSDSIALKVYKNRSDYHKWRSICEADSTCKRQLENKKIYYWVDQDQLRIDINTADSLEWKQLRGIGDKLSKRIVAYRTKLGGFVNKTQLIEVWGLQNETYQEIQSKLYLNKRPEKIKISENKEGFLQHPYLPYPVKKKVSNYLNRPELTIDSLSIAALPFIEDSVISKLSNYFYFE